MDMLGYGEDALTFWAMNHRLDAILCHLGDGSEYQESQIFFRPSFGRSGGEESPQFGELDFIILSRQGIYLGESKWNRSSEQVVSGVIALRPEQKLRHSVFKFYIEQWMSTSYENWHDFQKASDPVLLSLGIRKPIAPAGSLLASNLHILLSTIRRFYSVLPPITNVLLYLYDSRNFGNRIPVECEDFKIVAIDYSADTVGNFIKLS